MKKITVLIPTCNRSEALSVTLTSLCFQIENGFDIIISNQSEKNPLENNFTLKTTVRLLETKGHQVQILHNRPTRGMAQQRQFLLDHSTTVFSLFIDDDLILEPYVINNMRKILEEERCGFVGSAVTGLSYKYDIRHHEHNIEFWEGKVVPETIFPGYKAWERYKLHNAANIYHIEQKYQTFSEGVRKYKVAWVGGCVMYNTEKLCDVGGFNFWKDLPENHCGEDVLAQLRVMKKYGGCGIIPSGVYHQELETTIPDRKVNAPEYLDI